MQDSRPDQRGTSLRCQKRLSFTLALTKMREGDCVPIATVLPAPNLETDVSENGSNAMVREFVTILGVNALASYEMKSKPSALDTYILLLRTFKVHLDSRRDGIPAAR